MDIDHSETKEVGVSRSLSTPVALFELEMDTMMKSISDFSNTFPIPAEYDSRVTLTEETGSSVDIEYRPESDWDLDTRNPRNWSPGKKWAAVSVVSPPRRFYNWTSSINTCLIDLSVYCRRRCCQLHDGTCFATNRKPFPYYQRNRNRFDFVHIPTVLCVEPALVCAVIGNVRENVGGSLSRLFCGCPHSKFF
jgi:hypothetical protein